MLDRYFGPRHVLRRPARRPHVTQLNDFVAVLADRGHRPDVVRSYVKVAAHFLRWCERCRDPRRRFGAADCGRFVREHLPRCTCPASGTRVSHVVRAALEHLHPTTKGSSDTLCAAARRWVAAFDAHLRDACGVADATRTSYLQHVRRFLAEVGAARLPRLQPDRVRRFVDRRTIETSPTTVGVIGVALRSFFRFAALRGLSTAKLAAAVTVPVRRRPSGLRRSLSTGEATNLFRSFDRRTPVGRRDFAMATCLLDLGLRASEVAALTLKDLDFRGRELRLRPGKSRRGASVPLGDRAAAALADYLEHGRPRTDTPQVFVHHRAPFGDAITVLDPVVGAWLEPVLEHALPRPCPSSSAACRMKA